MREDIHVVHLTSVHKRNDTRIFLKQCKSLTRAGYNVSLIVADGLGNETRASVGILDVGKPSSRLKRRLSTTSRILRAAKSANALLYHIHDPELIPIGLRLKQLGKLVIFDSHEDTSKQIMQKPYLGRMLRSTASWTYERFERWASQRLDGVVSATPAITKNFERIGVPTTTVANYPIIDELVSTKMDWEGKDQAVCYVGQLSKLRGVRQMVEAVSLTKSGATLRMGGPFQDDGLEQELRTIDGLSQTELLGWLNREEIQSLFEKSVGGLVTLQPAPNHLEALPVKMFEYMSAGLPVIASNFPLWREIIVETDCGICVDPTNVQQIAEAIDELVVNPDRAQEMGGNGQRAVQRKYNWDKEAEKLVDFYDRLIEA